MSMLWSHEVLYSHTITEKSSNAYKDKEPKPQLDLLDRSVGDSINVLNILESVVFLVFYMTFSNLQNCVKSSPKMQEMAFQRL